MNRLGPTTRRWPNLRAAGREGYIFAAWDIRGAGYPRRGYPSAWSSQGDARHTLIGLAIGFGLGAALGAKGNTDQHPGAEVRAAVLFGIFGGMIGAAIGHGVPSFYARNGHHHEEPSEDEEAVNSRPETTRQTQLASDADGKEMPSSLAEAK